MKIMTATDTLRKGDAYKRLIIMMETSFEGKCQAPCLFWPDVSFKMNGLARIGRKVY